MPFTVFDILQGIKRCKYLFSSIYDEYYKVYQNPNGLTC